MPQRKPGTTNTLTSLPKVSAPPNPITGLVSGISGLANSGLFTPFGGAKPLNQQTPTLAAPQMSTIQSGGTTAMGTKLPQPSTTLPKAPQQTNVVQSAPVSTPSGTSATGHTTALPGGDSAAPAQTVSGQPLAFNPSFTGLVGQLSGFAQPSQVSNTALDTAKDSAKKYQDLTKEIKDTRDAEATSIAQIGGAPIPMGDITGRQQVARGLYETRLANLAAQAQGATALFSPAISSATTGTGQQISAAQSAVNAGQPQLGAFGQGYYDPLHPNAGAASGQYGTGPAAAANVGSIQEQTKLVNDWSGARAGASNITAQLNQFLQTNNVNPTDLNAVNKFLQAIGRQTSSTQYKQFQNLTTDLAALYAQILTPPGGNPSDYRTQIAQSLVDASASGQSIQSIISSLDQQAQQKIAGFQENIQKLSSGQNVNPTPTSPNTSGGSLWNW